MYFWSYTILLFLGYVDVPGSFPKWDHNGPPLFLLPRQSPRQLGLKIYSYSPRLDRARRTGLFSPKQITPLITEFLCLSAY